MGPRGLPGVGFSLTFDGDYDMKSKRLRFLGEGTEDNDAVKLAQLNAFDGHLSPKRDIDLQEKYNILNSKQRTFSELKIHYDTLVSWEVIAQNVLSRKETFPMNTSLDMNNQRLYNLRNGVQSHDVVRLDQLQSYLPLAGGTLSGNLDMARHKILNLPAEATEKTEAISTAHFDKQLVEEIVGVQNELDAEVIQLLPLDGSRQMIGDLRMNQKKIVDLPRPSDPSDAVKKEYVDDNFLSAFQLKRRLDANSNQIINHPEPTSNKEPVTKEYLDKELVSSSGSMENVFAYLQDVDKTSSEYGVVVQGFKMYSGSPHINNTRAFQLLISKKSARDQYACRIGFNFYHLPEGSYTFVVKFFPPTNTGVSIDCLSTSTNVYKQRFSNFIHYATNV